MPNHIHLIIELGEYNYNNGIANGDDDNVVATTNAQSTMVVQPRLQTNHLRNKTIQETTSENDHSQNIGQIANENI